MELTKEGQLVKGDRITIIGKSQKDTHKTTVKEIVKNERGGEEIIINKKQNKYFITSMVLSGDSWVDKVFIEHNRG